MAVKIYKPTTPGRRKSSVDSFVEITKKKPEKSLIFRKKQFAGRNNQGKITVHHRGGGARKLIRKVDFKRDRYDEIAKVVAIEYDPGRSAYIALVHYPDGEKRYILAVEGLQVGENIVSSTNKVEIKTGNRLPIKYIPAGIPVCNLEFTPGKGGQLVKSAGNSANVMGVEGEYAKVKLPSGEIRNFPKEALVTVGRVSNQSYRNIRWGKAGRMRHRGIRPTVRGKAMNPVDHPHGGGEGAQPIGLKHPKTASGKPALGVRTRKAKKKSNVFIIKKRHAKKKRK